MIPSMKKFVPRRSPSGAVAPSAGRRSQSVRQAVLYAASAAVYVVGGVWLLV